MAQHRKKCCTCGIPRAAKHFYKLKSSPDGLYPNCIDCYNELREPRREQINDTRRKWEQRIREEAIEHYGGPCTCCGEDALEFLTIVRTKGSSKIPSPYQLKKNGFPKGFHVLCFNCKASLKRFGYCPHWEEASI